MAEAYGYGGGYGYATGCGYGGNGTAAPVTCLGWDVNAFGNGTGWMTVETYVGSPEEAEHMVSAVVGKGFAPTGHIEDVRSTYRWQGEVVTRSEWRVSFDANQGMATSIASEILAKHSYQLPVVLLRPFAPATMPTKDWLGDSPLGTVW